MIKAGDRLWAERRVKFYAERTRQKKVSGPLVAVNKEFLIALLAKGRKNLQK